MKFLAKSIVAILVMDVNVPLPTSDIKLSDKYSLLKNLIPRNELESSRFILLCDIFNNFRTAFLVNAPLKFNLKNYVLS